MKNRRAFIRNRCSLKARVRSHTDQGEATIIDISIGGVGLLTKIPLREGQRVTLTPLNGKGGIASFLVQTVRHHLAGEGFRCGLKFAGSLPELLETWMFDYMASEEFTMEQVLERRRDRRFTFRAPATVEQGLIKRGVHVRNLSAGGMLVIQRQRPSPGSIQNFTVRIGEEDVQVRGQVLSCRPQDAAWQTSIKFVERPPASLLATVESMAA